MPNALTNPCELIIEPPCPVPLHPGGATEQAFDWETNFGSRAVLYQLAANSVGLINLSSRLFELSRHAQPAGVYLPIVREDQFLTGSSRFIGIPRDTSSRVALRVYDPRRSLFNDLHIELIAPGGAIIAETVLVPIVPLSSHEPGFAAIYDLTTTFQQLVSVQRFDVRLTPVRPGMEYWALVSVTDWDTQQVLLITAN